MESQDKIEVNYYPISMEESSSTGTAEKPASNTPAVALPSSNILQSSVGSVMVDNAIQSGNFAKGASGWKLDSDGNLEANNGNFRGDITGASGTFSGTVTVNEINIGGDDATSAHIDSDGNFWTGASVANKAIAPARINKDGTAYFTGVTTMGAVADEFTQITWDSTNLKVNGSFVKNEDAFGDGSDGNVTISGDTTLTTDMFYNDLTVNITKTLNAGGFRIFVKGTLTNNGTIHRNGETGGNGGNATGTGATGGSFGSAVAGATALASGSLIGSLKGEAGVVGVSGKYQINGGISSGTVGTTGTTGTGIVKSLVNFDGATGVNGGASGTATVYGNTSPSVAGGAGGVGGARTGTVFNKIHNFLSAYLLYDFFPTPDYLRTAPANGNAGAGGSGSCRVQSEAGWTAASGSTGGTGGGGGQGGVCWISARKIVNAGTFSANGGIGGNAGTTYTSNTSHSGGDGETAAAGSGGSSGGSGGNGGVLVLIYSSLTNTGTIEAVGGAGGSGATGGIAASFQFGGGDPVGATNGSAGATGIVGNAGVLISIII